MVNASLGDASFDKPRGYTLVELLVVLALLSLLAGLIIPRFHNLYGRSRLRQAAQQLARDLTTGRLLAIDHGCNYVVRHQRVGSSYTIAPQLQFRSESISQGDVAAPAVNGRDGEADKLALVRAGDGNSAARLTQPLRDDESMNEELPAGVVFGSANAASRQGTPAALPNPAIPTIPLAVRDKVETAAPAQIVGESPWTNALVFYPDGRSDSAELTLHAEHGYVVRLVIRGLTGGIAIGPIERPTPRTVGMEYLSGRAAFATPIPNEPNNAW